MLKRTTQRYAAWTAALAMTLAGLGAMPAVAQPHEEVPAGVRRVDPSEAPPPPSQRESAPPPEAPPEAETPQAPEAPEAPEANAQDPQAPASSDGVQEVPTQRVEMTPANARSQTAGVNEPVNLRGSLDASEQMRRQSPDDAPASAQPAPQPQKKPGRPFMFQNNRQQPDPTSPDSVTTLPGAPPGSAPAAGGDPASAAGNVAPIDPAALRQAYRQAVDAYYDKAVAVAMQASTSDDPFLRSNAIEALQPVPSRVLGLVERGLSDPSPVVRFAALMTIGEQKIRTLGPQAAALVHDSSQSVQAAALFAGRETGQKVNLDNLAGLLQSDSSGVRRNVCLVFQGLGDPSAIPMILDLATRPTRRMTPVGAALARTEAAKTVVMLGDDSEIEVVRASAYSSYPEVRVVAIMAMGDLDDRVMQPAVSQMLARQMPEQAPEINLAAAYALARMGDYSGLATMLKWAQTPVIEFQGRQYPAAPLRAQAAAGLRYVPAPRAAQMLGTLLDDPVEQVRITAAASLIAAKHQPAKR